MNWYKKAQFKTASVSFWIEGSDKIAQPMNKLDICYDLSRFIFYELEIGQKLGLTWQDIDPDISNSSPFEGTGQINIYLKNPIIKEGIIKNIIDQYNEYKAGMIILQFLEINQSGISAINTARILISKNETQSLSHIPEMNLSNYNADALLNLLSNEGMEELDTIGGSLNVSILKDIINKIEQDDYVINTYTEEPSEEHIENGPSLYHGGRSSEQFSEYLYILKEMIAFMERNNLPNGTINYG